MTSFFPMIQLDYLTIQLAKTFLLESPLFFKPSSWTFLLFEICGFNISYSLLEFLTPNFPLQIWSLKENFWGIEIIFPSFPRAKFLPPYFPKYHSQLWLEYLNEFQGKMPLCLTDLIIGAVLQKGYLNICFYLFEKILP